MYISSHALCTTFFLSFYLFSWSLLFEEEQRPSACYQWGTISFFWSILSVSEFTFGNKLVGMCSSLQDFHIWVSLRLKKIGRFTLNLFAFTSYQSDAFLDFFFFFAISSLLLLMCMSGFRIHGKGMCNRFLWRKFFLFLGNKSEMLFKLLLHCSIRFCSG